MPVQDFDYEIPTWAAALIVVLVGATFAFGIVVRQSIAEPIAWWLAVGRIALSLFVVYLFYRFVIAVEKIADKM